jgi:hypothetical protein
MDHREIGWEGVDCIQLAPDRDLRRAVVYTVMNLRFPETYCATEKITGYTALMGEVTNAWKILVGKPEGKRPHRRHRRRWEDNIRMDLSETVWEDMDWLYLVRKRDQWNTASAP